LLAGIAANANRRIRELISFSREPAALQTLASSSNAETRKHAEQVKALFSWPEHQSDHAAARPPRSLTSTEETQIARGKILYSQICAGCHGARGEGLRPVAPPLSNSQWVTNSANRLIRITLQGVQGVFHVDGIAYQAPAVLPEMPPLAALGDAQLASVLSYIRQEWGHDATPISEEQIATIRKATSLRSTPWTEAELLKIE